MLNEQKTMAFGDGSLTIDVHGENDLIKIYDTTTRIGLDIHKDAASHVAMFLLNISIVQKDAQDIDFSVIDQEEAERLQEIVESSKRIELEHYVIETDGDNMELSLLEDACAKVSIKIDDVLFLANALLWGAIQLKESDQS